MHCCYRLHIFNKQIPAGAGSWALGHAEGLHQHSFDLASTLLKHSRGSFIDTCKLQYTLNKLTSVRKSAAARVLITKLHMLEHGLV